MGKLGIRFAESAVVDPEEIRLWHADQGGPDGGKRLIGEIFRRIQAIGVHPESGRIAPEFDQPFLREPIQPPFRIGYRHDPGMVGIARVWRSVRLLGLHEGR